MKEFLDKNVEKVSLSLSSIPSLSLRQLSLTLLAITYTDTLSSFSLSLSITYASHLVLKIPLCGYFNGQTSAKGCH